ncbi:MAG: hypothetical protein AABX51_04855 [Nanoarchaeota archaeon]
MAPTKRKTVPKPDIPTFSTALPEYGKIVGDIRKKLDDYFTRSKDKLPRMNLTQIIETLKDLISPADFIAMREYEIQQSQVRIATINDHEMLYQPSTHSRIRTRTDALENVLFNEFAQHLPYAEAGIQIALGLAQSPSINWRYSNVASTISVDGLTGILAKNENIGRKKICQQLYEYEVASRIVGDSQTVISKLPNTVLRDRDILRQRQRYTLRGSSQGGNVVLDSTRHCWTAENLDEIINEAPVRGYAKKGWRHNFDKFDPVFEVHDRLKTAGDLVLRGHAIWPGQVLGHGYAIKFARYLAGEKKDINDLLAGRDIGDFRFMEPVMGKYMFDLNSNPEFWKGRVIAHDFKDERIPRQHMIGKNDQNTEYVKFLRAVAHDMIMENSPTGESMNKPPHMEFLIPVVCVTESGEQFEMVKARQWWNPSYFHSSQTREGVTHTDYKGSQIDYILKKESKKTMAVYAFICGLVEGYPGLVEPQQIPLVSEIFRISQERLDGR